MDYILDYNEQLSEWEAANEIPDSIRPKCDKCGKPIRAGHFYDVDGDFICPDCMDRYLRCTEDYFDD
jgi:formylmethanofuran dehydrogenase subunit E